jgi:hypothetical protein
MVLLESAPPRVATRYARVPFRHSGLVDLTADICRERGVRTDMAGFQGGDDDAERRRAASRFTMSSSPDYSGTTSSTATTR